MREALKAYEEGIEIKCKDVEINTKLLSNRTLINLKLSKKMQKRKNNTIFIRKLWKSYC